MAGLSVERVVRYFPVPVGLTSATAADDDAPVPARPASTVMVVRDAATGEGGVEVFMLRRSSSMAFAPNRLVFPGGGVDPRDGDDDLPWAGPSPADWAEQLGAHDEAEARELVVAAAREVFEECGVLLAGPDDASLVGDVSGADWHAERDRLASHEQAFSEMLVRHGYVLRTDLLRPWAHWVTPEFERRRYDTRFFLARLPEGQIPDDRTSEADTADWVSPADLLAEAEAGSAALLPPTIVCLESLAAAADSGDLLAAAPPMARVMPTLEPHGDGARLRMELPVAGRTS
ncbi:NUDIX hydrolase [Mobilicoccus caccae]|uniref:Nudix hydrolase domain-containing protein n=1 Tax=Mobilicoccus caccae TaxID=1859295 RepID=A0ABQ6IMF3_9MICO|nr:NUDIX domain-containing protein [Mobilicoccus caccae]GMA38281.1 hypothetical protein GCM10025883_03260 [Mobilicoccus caccae]